MKPDRGSSVPWIVVGIFAALLCCLCLVIAVTVPVAIVAWWGTGPDFLPTPTIRAVGTPTRVEPPTTTPIEVPERVTPVAPPAPVPHEAEETRRLLGSIEVPVADPLELAERLQGVVDAPRVLAETASPIAIGTIESFWVQNVDTNEYFQVKAEMVYATPHVYLWVDATAAYEMRDAQRLVDTFEDKIYPTNREFFGSEWTPGVDGDPHLYILYARGLGSWVAGYYGSNDEYSPLVHEFSNGHEMFYINADGQSLAAEYTYSTLAHEFQHMIHWYRDPNEDNWVDEGFSELASFLNGYDVGGWDYAYVAEPDVPLTYWPTEGDVHYGQSFLFMAYFLDRFGPDVTQALVVDPANGLDSVDRTLAAMEISDPLTGDQITADDVFSEWAAAMLLLDPSVGDGRYSLQSYAGAPSLIARDRYRECPVARQSLDVSQYGIDIIGIDCRGDYTLVFDGESLVQVVPGEAHSGDWSFWSNRGNVSDMTLTRSFDFSGVESPIEVSYWLWYDIEEDWDYVYMEVSEDGGDTWQILTTTSGTPEDPTGNSYGWGYTGFSGGGSEAIWIEETVDLSAFAGKEIMLRFEYVTDASVNGEGLVLDDVSIPAIGYSEDFESGEGGWQGDGFVRLYNLLPQTYRLVLVEQGTSTRVTGITLDENRHAEVPLTLGGEFRQATVLVMGTTRYTWRPAPYTIEVKP